MENRTFFMGGKDLEMQTIKDVLDQNGEHVLDKNLGRGAKIDDYQEEIKELNDQELFACELEGAGEGIFSHIVSLNHHGERAHEKATLLQVLDVLGIPATLEHRLVAANDSGYIPAMINLLQSEGINDEAEQQKMIALIRLQDRKAQGISSEQEKQAEEAIKTKEQWANGRLTVVKIPHSKCATVTDRLFGQYQNLLVLSDDGEVNFYGDGRLCQELKDKFQGWNGGSGLGIKGGNAYRGGYPNHQEIQEHIKESLEEEKILYHLDLIGDTLKLKFGETASNDQIVAYVEKTLKQKIETKELGGGEIIKLDGPASLPVAVVLTHKLAHIYGSIAVWDPKLGKFVVAVSHNGKFAVGDTLS